MQQCGRQMVEEMGVVHADDHSIRTGTVLGEKCFPSGGQKHERIIRNRSTGELCEGSQRDVSSRFGARDPLDIFGVSPVNDAILF